jgi:hypothetical protein
MNYTYRNNIVKKIKKSLDQGCRGINKLSMKLFISIIFDIYLTTFKFQREHKNVIIKSYYSNGNRGENGKLGLFTQFMFK